MYVQYLVFFPYNCSVLYLFMSPSITWPTLPMHFVISQRQGGDGAAWRVSNSDSSIWSAFRRTYLTFSFSIIDSCRRKYWLFRKLSCITHSPTPFLTHTHAYRHTSTHEYIKLPINILGTESGVYFRFKVSQYWSSFLLSCMWFNTVKLWACGTLN